jgi:hypothetical protein
MAKNSGLSRSTVGRIWKAFQLKPHQGETFKLSKDPLFVDNELSTHVPAIACTG